MNDPQDPHDPPPGPATSPVPVLDYARLQPTRRTSPLAKMLLLSHGIQFVVFVLYAVQLDGGVTARRCFAVSSAYWLMTVLILVRRRLKPTTADLAFVGFGYLLMLLITEPFSCFGVI